VQLQTVTCLGPRETFLHVASRRIILPIYDSAQALELLHAGKVRGVRNQPSDAS
jgi:hypothetical protein